MTVGGMPNTIHASSQGNAGEILRAFQDKVQANVSAAFLWDGRPLLAFGSSENLYPLYSLTKSIIAFMVLEQARLRSVDLSTAVGALPKLDLPTWVQLLTLEDLLNHTSGLRDYGHLEEYHSSVRGQPPCPWSAKEFIRHVTRDGPAFPQGEDFLYSNPGYMLLVHWLQRESGKALRLLFHENVAAKLKLPFAFVAETMVDFARCAPGYSTYFSPEPQDVRPLYHPGWVSHGLVVTTATEAAFMLNAIVPRLLDRDIEAIPRLPFDVPDCAEPFYFHGLMGDRRFATFGHNGGGPGYSVSAFKRDALSVCVICDKDDLEPERAVRKILSLNLSASG